MGRKEGMQAAAMRVGRPLKRSDAPTHDLARVTRALACAARMCLCHLPPLSPSLL